MSVAGSHLCPFSARPVTKHQAELFTFCIFHLHEFRLGAKMMFVTWTCPECSLAHLQITPEMFFSLKDWLRFSCEISLTSSDEQIAGSPSSACTNIDTWSNRAAGALRRSPPCKNSPPAEWRRQILPVSFIVSGGCLCDACCFQHRSGLSCRARIPSCGWVYESRHDAVWLRFAEYVKVQRLHQYKSNHFYLYSSAGAVCCCLLLPPAEAAQLFPRHLILRLNGFNGP